MQAYQSNDDRKPRRLKLYVWLLIIASVAVVVLCSSSILFVSRYSCQPWATRVSGCLFTLDHPDSVEAVTFSSDGQMLATGASDEKARIWNVQDRRFRLF